MLGFRPIASAPIAAQESHPTGEALYGSFVETGEAALFQAKMAAANGAFTLTGSSSSGLQNNYPAHSGSFVETGEAALFQVRMLSTYGAFTLTGESVAAPSATIANYSRRLGDLDASFGLSRRISDRRSFTATGGFATPLPIWLGAFTVNFAPTATSVATDRRTGTLTTSDGTERRTIATQAGFGTPLPVWVTRFSRTFAPNTFAGTARRTGTVTPSSGTSRRT